MLSPALLGLLPIWLLLGYLSWAVWFRPDGYQWWLQFNAGLQWNKLAEKVWLSGWMFWSMRVLCPLLFAAVSIALIRVAMAPALP
ncbi:MAG: hypothetical protein DCC55_40420 [Chloroflexi bacterium]|nr:MAG: hypothetical protein DCC55_40420 [Chloroflexota bacterium]